VINRKSGISMKKCFAIFIGLFCSISTFAQLSIPDFKDNAAGKTKPPFFAYINQYDLVLAVRIYSNWSLKAEYHLLVLSGGHWKKLIYQQFSSSDPLLLQKPPIKEKPANDFLCDLLFNKLIGAHLFTMEDDSSIPPCDKIKKTVNGQEIVNSYMISDGPEYSIWIVTPGKSRQLYYYAPEYFNAHCSPDEHNREYAMNVMNIFNTEW